MDVLMTFRRAAIIFAILLAGIAITLPRIWGQIFPNRTWNPDSPYYKAELLQQSRRSRQFHDTTVFIGDSEIVGLAVSDIASRTENFGIGGDTIDGLISRVPAYDWMGVSTVVIEIGINNMPLDHLVGIGEKYRRLLALFPAGMPVTAISIFPVNDQAKGVWPITGINAAIVQANSEIAAACARQKNCRFIDIHSRLRGQDGRLRSEFDAGDGLHISTVAYNLLKNTLRESQ
jgi:lysophospholipase L1-like esterase